MMRFYDGQHRYCCGLDVHTKRMYLCVLDRDGNKRLHRNVRTRPHDFLKTIEDVCDEVIVGVECMVTRYWLADLCEDESFEFLLGLDSAALTFIECR